VQFLVKPVNPTHVLIVLYETKKGWSISTLDLVAFDQRRAFIIDSTPLQLKARVTGLLCIQRTSTTWLEESKA